jgi:hypothetical protein
MWYGFWYLQALCFRAEKTPECEQDEAMKNYTVAKADRLIPGMEARGAESGIGADCS